MEIYEIVLLELDTRNERSVEVEVDEAELSDNITIRASLNEQEITSANDNYLPAYQEFRDKIISYIH